MYLTQSKTTRFLSEVPLLDSDMNALLLRAMKDKQSVQVALPLTQRVEVAVGGGSKAPLQVIRLGTNRYGVDFGNIGALEILLGKMGIPKRQVLPTDVHIQSLFYSAVYPNSKLFGNPKRWYPISATKSVLIYHDKFLYAELIG